MFASHRVLYRDLASRREESKLNEESADVTSLLLAAKPWTPALSPENGADKCLPRLSQRCLRIKWTACESVFESFVGCQRGRGPHPSLLWTLAQYRLKCFLCEVIKTTWFSCSFEGHVPRKPDPRSSVLALWFLSSSPLVFRNHLDSCSQMRVILPGQRLETFFGVTVGGMTLGNHVHCW